MSSNFWNPWHGCHKCSPGCQNCYMYALDAMRGVAEKSSVVARTKQFDMPLRRDRHKNFKVKAGEYLKVNMTSDTFVEEAEGWLPEMWGVIRQRPDVRFWVLTKRPERMAKGLPDDWGDGWDNVSLNITVENQEAFDCRWPVFERIPAKHKGLCVAPMIGPVDVMPAVASSQIEEVQLGGENYDNPRPCHDEWVRGVADVCRAYDVSFVFYETGTRFVKDGTEYYLPGKATQAEQAYLSGYSCQGRGIEWTLRDPVDGRVLADGELRKRVFNVHSCMHCSQWRVCNGCSGCGKCKTMELIDEDVFARMKERL